MWLVGVADDNHPMQGEIYMKEKKYEAAALQIRLRCIVGRAT